MEKDKEQILREIILEEFSSEEAREVLKETKEEFDRRNKEEGIKIEESARERVYAQIASDAEEESEEFNKHIDGIKKKYKEKPLPERIQYRTDDFLENNMLGQFIYGLLGLAMAMAFIYFVMLFIS